MFAITMPASKPGKVYTLRKVAETVWTCDCPDHVFRANGAPYVCKHIAELQVSLHAFAKQTTSRSKRAEELLA